MQITRGSPIMLARKARSVMKAIAVQTFSSSTAMEELGQV
jgi:hypothetical protein